MTFDEAETEALLLYDLLDSYPYILTIKLGHASFRVWTFAHKLHHALDLYPPEKFRGQKIFICEQFPGKRQVKQLFRWNWKRGIWKEVE